MGKKQGLELIPLTINPLTFPLRLSAAGRAGECFLSIGFSLELECYSAITPAK
jgi:hypothetical protein